MSASVSPSPPNRINSVEIIENGRVFAVVFTVVLNFPLRLARTVTEGISCEPVAALLALSSSCPGQPPLSRY